MTYATISILFYNRGSLLKHIFVIPVCHIWFDHWNGWVESMFFTNATKSDAALQDHVWCAQQLMGFQSSGPKIEVVCSKRPWNIFSVSACVFVTNCFDLLLRPYGAQLFAIAHLFFVAQGGHSSPLCPRLPQNIPALLSLLSALSQCNPHVQCKNQGTCFWFVRVQRKYSHIYCPTKGPFAWISLEVNQLDFSLQLRPWYSDPSQTFCGIVSCVMQKDLQ